MTKFDFTEEEVQLNRKGVFSERQKQVVHAMAYSMRSSSKSGVWIIIAFLCLGLCIIVPLNLQGLNERNIQTLGLQMLAELCLIIFVAAAAIAFVPFNGNRLAVKLEAAPLLSAEGVISYGSDYSSNYGLRSYYVYFGKKRFSFPNEMNRTFPKGSTFRIYYCKVGQIELIMSFERLT